jgi:carboxylesterase type B
MLAYGGKTEPLFHQAIAQSGSAMSNPGVSSSLSAKRFAAVATKVNCVSGSADSDATVSCLRKVPMDELLNATFEVAYSVEPQSGFAVL